MNAVRGECDCCGFKRAKVKVYERDAQLCELCANTAHRYPNQYEGEVATLKTICFVGNVLIDEIRKRML